MDGASCFSGNGSGGQGGQPFGDLPLGMGAVVEEVVCQLYDRSIIVMM